MARHASIDVEIDYHDWLLATRALEVRMWRAAFQATQSGLHLIERNVKAYLRTFTHPYGTPTPSPRGAPPALIYGNLRRSWRNVHAHEGRKPHTIEAWGGPTTVYSRIQELGGLAGRNHSARIPKRPYVKPMALASRRGIRRIYVEYLTAAIRG